MPVTPEPGAQDRQRQLRLRGQVAMLAALVWIAAAFDLPAPVAAVPVALAALALSQFLLHLRLRTPAGATTTARQRPAIGPDILALSAVALAGLILLAVRLTR
jgi:hypothetical protein